MGDGAWSNDQLNRILVYDIDGTTVILRVDSDGLYYYNKTNGSFFKVSISPYPVDGAAVAAFLQPGVSAVPGVVYDLPGQIIAGESVIAAIPGKVFPGLVLTSPAITGKVDSELQLYGQSSTSAVDDSEIDFLSSFMYSRNLNEIGQGTLDEGGNYTTSTFTGTEIAADYLAATVGVMTTTRRYEGRWTGTVQSGTSGDRIGLRIYSGPNSGNLTGATLLADCGQITVPAANTPAPFYATWGFNGLPGKYLLLGARRVSGAGTCFATINYRRLEDVIGAY